MKLIRFGEAGEERPGVLTDDQRILDASEFVRDWDGDALSDEHLSDKLQAIASDAPAVQGAPRIGPCVAAPGKIICVGLNYTAHANETGAPIPKEPVLFGKATSAICGPNDNLVIPRGAEKVDWEVELGVVIGRAAKYVREEDALDYVAGYCTVHDVSERAFQIERGGQWIKGKSCDTFCPLGPWLVTADEVAQPNNLRLWLSVDGEMRQDSNTSDMIFYVPRLVAYISEFMSLQPGDIISTGTPQGVALGMKEPKYLRAGQVVELGVEGLGEQRQVVV